MRTPSDRTFYTHCREIRNSTAASQSHRHENVKNERNETTDEQDDSLIQPRRRSTSEIVRNYRSRNTLTHLHTASHMSLTAYSKSIFLIFSPFFFQQLRETTFLAFRSFVCSFIQLVLLFCLTRTRFDVGCEVVSVAPYTLAHKLITDRLFADSPTRAECGPGT